MPLPQVHRDSFIDLGPPSTMPGDIELDTLPPYTNNVRLATLCYRKREFRAAFDKTPRGRRTWELVWLVLDGTALRVYKAERDEKSILEKTEIGLPRLEAGTHDPSGMILDHPRSSTSTNDTSDISRPSHLQGTLTASHMSLPEPRRRVPPHKLPTNLPPPYVPHQAGTSSAFSASTPFLLTTPAQGIADGRDASDAYDGARNTSGVGSIFTTNTPDFSKRKATRQYPLQHAICMRPEGYTKRDHVLRFILHDGKQFLVQLFSRAEAVAWLQVRFPIPFLFFIFIGFADAHNSSCTSLHHLHSIWMNVPCRKPHIIHDDGHGHVRVRGRPLHLVRCRRWVRHCRWRSLLLLVSVLWVRRRRMVRGRMRRMGRRWIICRRRLGDRRLCGRCRLLIRRGDWVFSCRIAFLR